MSLGKVLSHELEREFKKNATENTKKRKKNNKEECDILKKMS